MRRCTIAFAAILFLSGCATMSEEDCATADWNLLGEDDGLAGETYEKFAQRADRCLKFGHEADENAYREGRDRGLGHYCTPDNGYETGRSGGAYRGVCPADLEAEFLAEYNIGRRLYELSGAHQSAVEAYDNAVAALDTARRNLRDVRDRLRDDQLPAEERERLQSDADRYRDEIDRIERDLPRLDRNIDDALGRLDDYRDYLDRRGRRY